VTTFDPNNVKIAFVRNMDDAFNFLEWVKTVPDQLIGLDVETDGLNWFDGRLRLVQFGTLTEGWAVPFEENKALVTEALRILDERQRVFVGHNFSFDLHFIQRATGWLPSDWARVHDTLFLASVINSTGAKGLKDLSEYYVWDGAKSGQDALKNDMKRGGWDWGTVPVDLPSYWIYGVLDTILTVALFWVLRRRATEAAVMDAYEVERAARPAIFAIENNGMLLDSEHARAKQDELHQRCAQIENEVLQYGIDNINSTAQIALAFLDAGVELTEKTASGQWKMDRETFDIIAATNNHPLVNLVNEHRSATKMASTYYGNFLDFQRSDGRCHPFYRQVVARTGRMSADSPAIMTVPRASTNADVRNSFVAPEGHILVSTDFSNVEARVFAHFAQEAGMIQAFKDGIDLHCYTAKEIFQMSEMPSKDDPHRQIAKSVLFALAFGAGTAKIAVTAGVPFADADRAVKGLHRAFPGIKDFQRRSTQAAVDNLNAHGQAFVRGLDNRVLAMVESSDAYYAFTNWQIQSAACVILKKRLAVLDSMGMSKYLVACIHDEVVAEIPEDFEEEYGRLVSEAMQDNQLLSVPIVSATAQGAVRWGDCK
jgi:DNA polymerase-1